MTHSQQISNIDDDSGTVDLEERIRKYGHINMEMIHMDEIHMQLTLAIKGLWIVELSFILTSLLVVFGHCSAYPSSR